MRYSATETTKHGRKKDGCFRIAGLAEITSVKPSTCGLGGGGKGRWKSQVKHTSRSTMT